MRHITDERGAPPNLGVSVEEDGVHFAVFSDHADLIELCLFEPSAIREAERLPLTRGKDGMHFGFVPNLTEGALYGYRASGPFDPAAGHRFDPSKLLVDPYTVRLDRPFLYHPMLAAPPERHLDTAPIMPRCVVSDLKRDAAPLPFAKPGFTYELLVRAFSQRHPGVPVELRGTVAALRQPVLLDHLTRLGVETVELMPLAATIDERHLAGLGLSNAWGYNSVTHMAPDPRLAPGGFAEIRETVRMLHERGIRVLLDVVLNHSGESDKFGPTLCYRGLDNRTYYATSDEDPGTLINDTGTGNTFAIWRQPVARLMIDTLRTWVDAAGIDGFRYDLGPILGRTPTGFDREAPFFRMLSADPVLKGRIHVAEPWDIGPGGYQVGNFPPPFIEWQDKFRDDVRRFWRGEGGMISALATRLSGSPDIFEGRTPSDGVNFVAAHDGFTLADLVAFNEKHNEPNGEGNRDGHNDNHSWNNGIEGPTLDTTLQDARVRDVRALLATLMISRGNPMLVAGDEMGRTQVGNNNAYSQDNEIIWLDWDGADEELFAFTARLAALRHAEPALHADAFLLGNRIDGDLDVNWLSETGKPMAAEEWNDPERRFLGARLKAETGNPVLVFINGSQAAREVILPPLALGRAYRLEVASNDPALETHWIQAGKRLVAAARSVTILTERPHV